MNYNDYVRGDKVTIRVHVSTGHYDVTLKNVAFEIGRYAPIFAFVSGTVAIDVGTAFIPRHAVLKYELVKPQSASQLDWLMTCVLPRPRY
jgi:hypothetical protein